MTPPFLPTLNAGFNLASLAFLLLGRGFIRRKNVAAHRLCMGAALAASTAFLAGYLVHHARAGVTRFEGGGAARTIYLTVLGTHTVLAAAIVPLVFVTLGFALRDRPDRHRAWARWTWPLWTYVSSTGLLIYAMLYLRP